MLTTKGNGMLCMILFISPTLAYIAVPDYFWVVDGFKLLDFDYPTAKARQADIDSGVFQPLIPAPIDIDVHFNYTTRQLRKFVSIPRFQRGSPATLGTVVYRNGRDPIIKPYPSWDWHRDAGKCKTNRIASVYRVMIDECDRLWVLDNGQVDGDQVVCNPQLLAFDLRTDRLITRYQFPKDQWTKNSTFVTPVVDIINTCEDTFVYNADCIGASIVVYDHKRKSSWLVTDKTMLPDPNFYNFSIKGQSWQLQDGVLGMSISRVGGRDTRLYYHALSSNTEHYIRTRDLQNPTLFGNKNYSHLIYTYKGTRRTQSAAEATDSEGVMYFGLVSDVAVACYNTAGDYSVPGRYTAIVGNNQQTLQFVSGAKVIKIFKGHEDLWILTSRFQKVATGTLNPKEINFRILKADTIRLKTGTNCDPRFSPTPRSERQVTVVPGQNSTQINNDQGPVLFPEVNDR